jgi:hypothetical protein
VDLLLLDRDTLGVRTKFRVSHPGHFQDGNYALLHREFLYGARPSYDVMDAQSGALLEARGNLFFCRAGRGYPPLALSGDRVLYVADNATWFQPTLRPYLSVYPGAMTTIEAGRNGLILAMNRIEPLNGGIAFDGDRLYIRGTHSLMCIGYTGKPGQAYEAATVADQVLQQVYPARPQPTTALKATPLTGQEPKRIPLMRTRSMALEWLLITGLPSEGHAELAQSVARTNPLSTADDATQIQIESASYPCRRLKGGNMPEWGEDGPFETSRFGSGAMKHIGWNEFMGDRIDLRKVVQPKAGSFACATTALRVDYRQFLMVEAGHPDARAWVGGVELKPGQPIDVAEGVINLTILFPTDTVDGDRTFLGPRLWPATGTEDDVTTWMANVRRCKPYLDQAISLAPDSSSAVRGRKVLAAAGL